MNGEPFVPCTDCLPAGDRTAQIFSTITKYLARYRARLSITWSPSFPRSSYRPNFVEIGRNDGKFRNSLLFTLLQHVSRSAAARQSRETLGEPLERTSY